MKRQPLFLTACLGALFTLSGCPAGGGDAPANDSGEPNASETGGGGAETPEAPPAKPFVQSELRGPWKHAKVGDFAVYREGSDKPQVFRYEVAKMDGATVTVSRQELKDGNPVGEANMVDFDMQADDEKYKKPSEYDALTEDPKEQEHTLEGGKSLTVVVMKRKGAGSETETWLAEDDVRPFHGQSVVRSVRDGVKNLELLDFGSK
ncbi:MAG: hypothetical protein KDD82_10710 [Planctomycetes bacterium]|nr:hypothetical protein [Planctomycetota bacterium]